MPLSDPKQGPLFWMKVRITGDFAQLAMVRFILFGAWNSLHSCKKDPGGQSIIPGTCVRVWPSPRCSAWPCGASMAVLRSLPSACVFLQGLGIRLGLGCRV